MPEHRSKEQELEGPAIGLFPEGERQFETGSDEAWKASTLHEEGIKFGHVYRNQLAYQDLDLERARQGTMQRDQLHAAAFQALTNAVSTANMVQQEGLKTIVDRGDTSNMINKQSVAHRDIAINDEWGLDEDTWATKGMFANSTSQDKFADVVGAVVTQVLAQMAAKKQA